MQIPEEALDQEVAVEDFPVEEEPVEVLEEEEPVVLVEEPASDEYVEDLNSIESSVDGEVSEVSRLLDEAVARLADIQELLPEDAQPLVTYMADIIDNVGDVIEFMFDNMVDSVAGDTDDDVDEAVSVVGDEAAARPDDLRDLTLALQHIPGVEDNHLVRVARLADTLQNALARSRGLRDRVQANPIAYQTVFGEPEEEV